MQLHLPNLSHLSAIRRGIRLRLQLQLSQVWNDLIMQVQFWSFSEVASHILLEGGIPRRLRYRMCWGKSGSIKSPQFCLVRPDVETPEPMLTYFGHGPDL